MSLLNPDRPYELIGDERSRSIEPRYEVGVRAVAQPMDSVVVYGSLLRRRYKLITGLTCLGVAIAIVVGLTGPMYYRAHASLELGGLNDMYLGIRDLTSAASDSVTDSYVQTQVRVISSEVIVGSALKRVSVGSSTPAPQTGRFSIAGLLQKTGLRYFTPITSENSGIASVMRHLVVHQEPQSRVIDITYDDKNPFLAADFTNALANEYIAASLERRLEDTESTETWLNAYVSELEKGLERSGRNLESYAHESGLVGTSDSDTPAEARLKDLQSELSKAHSERVSKQALFETASNGPQDEISATINPSPMREYQAKLGELRSQLAEASATLTPAHYKVQQLQAQIDEVKSLVDKEWQKTLAVIRSDYRTALLREKLLAESVQQQTLEVADQAGKRVHYDVLRRELETNQQVYNTMLEKAKESGVLSTTKPTTIHILDHAYAPAFPFSPSLPIYGSVGGLSGLFAALMLAAYIERREKNLMAPGMLTGTPFRQLGIIPSAKLDQKVFNKRQLPLRVIESSISDSAASKQRPQGEVALVKGESGLFRDAFHATVASILRFECNGTHPQVITVTSPVAGDGKTTTVRNLGLALASTSRCVVLIEGDLRYPRLSSSFGLANSWGLTDILRSTNSLEDIPFESLVRPTGKADLFVLPSGPAVANVSSLLQSPRMTALIEKLKQHATQILIDSPPLLAVSDARILTACSDSVILVVRAHETNRETFRAVARQLVEDRTPIMGTILNGWDPRRGGADPFLHHYSYENYHRE